MSPTVFDSALEEERAKRAQLERELAELKAQMKDQSSTLPKREETVIQHEESSIFENTDEEETSVKGLLSDLTHEAKETETPTTESSESSKESTKEPGLSRDPKEYSELMRREKPTKNPLAAFSIRPPNVNFDTRHEKEKILMVLRQHPIVNLRWIFITLIGIILPLTVFRLFPLFDFIPGRFQFFSMIGWYMLVLAFTIESFLHWYFNIYIITDERIVDIDFHSLIYRSVSSAKIENIEDTTASTKGVLGAIFNMGDVTIQTAAEKREFEFLSVPQPVVVTKFINELILEEEREKLEGRVM